MTKKLAVVFGCLATAAQAQTSEHHFFRALLSSANEVPAITTVNASGTATLHVHLVRDTQGQIASGTVDFLVRHDLAPETVITGLHIHPAAVGVNGPVSVDSGIGRSNPFRFSPPPQGLVGPGNTAGLATLNGLLQNPQNYYVNLHTAEFPGGIMRGQVQRTEQVTVAGIMSTQNEVPPIPNYDASGVGAVTAIVTRDAAGAINSAEVVFNVVYSLPEQTTLTGLHVHSGRQGANGPVIIDSGLRNYPEQATTPANGQGRVVTWFNPDVSRQVVRDTLDGWFFNPGDFYINLHTTQFPGGVIRSQLRPTDTMFFSTVMQPANEVPPIANLNAIGYGNVTMMALRDPANGSVQTAAFIFDVNHRFPEAAQFTGFHIHRAPAGQNGPVLIDSGLGNSVPPADRQGFGSLTFFFTMPATPQTATLLNDLVEGPEAFYLNLHTSINRGGAVRGQLAPFTTAQPAVSVVISAVSDIARSTVAPGGLMTVFGSNLVKLPSVGREFDGESVPTEWNGTEITIDGRKAPITWLTPTFAVVQVPVETNTGNVSVSVSTANGSSSSLPVTVAPLAPALFFYELGGVIKKGSDLTFVRPDNPVTAGDVILIYGTGLGQTTPALSTGRQVPATPAFNTASLVTVNIGGQNVPALSAVAYPGILGLYEIAVRVPSGLGPGTQPLSVRQGDAVSNTVNLAVR